MYITRMPCVPLSAYAFACACVGRVRAWIAPLLYLLPLCPPATRAYGERGRENERQRKSPVDRVLARPPPLHSPPLLTSPLLSSPHIHFSGRARLGNRNCNSALHYLRETACKRKNESDETALYARSVIYGLILLQFHISAH